jgi:3-hydroxyisobutyrate dehydrogenase-like beta-hydroxyacid dehydrogenase
MSVPLGFVGLGLMGSAIVTRLLEKGHVVIGHNRTRSKARGLEEAGMRFAESPREVAAAADIVFSMVTDTKALRSIVDGPGGILAGLKPGTIYVDMSTVDADASREIAEAVARAGSVMLDAPVSGSVVTIQRGELSIMVGGHREAFERVKPVLLDIGPKVNHVGGNGLAVAMKIAVNLSIGVQMQAFSESVLLAEKCGIARKTAIEVLTNSAVASPMIKYRAPFVLAPPDPVWFNVNMMQKDLNLAIAMGQRLGVPLPSTTVSNEMFTAARGMGFADKEMSVVFDVMARLSGVST